MSDVPFQRPGSHPGGTGVHHDSLRPSVWEEPDSGPEVVELGDVRHPPEEPPTRGRLDLALAAALGIVVGVVGTVFALDAGNGSEEPLEITPATFPREVMNLLRDDLSARDLNDVEAVARLDEQFAQQLASFRFSYGGEGATMHYAVGGSGFDYTILNGILSPPLPNSDLPDNGSLGDAVVVSHVSDDVVCTIRTTGADRGWGTSRPRSDLRSAAGWSSCVLTDDERTLSLRLTEVGMHRHDAVRSAVRMAAELRRLHEDLTS